MFDFRLTILRAQFAKRLTPLLRFDIRHRVNPTERDACRQVSSEYDVMFVSVYSMLANGNLLVA